MRLHISNEDRPSITFLKMTNQALVTKRSPFSGRYHTATLNLTDEQYSDWLAGTLIQNAVPHLSAEEREFLMTGITPEEWAATFRSEDQ